MADGVNGNDLSWSADSQHLYASRPTGNQPEILRISVSDAKVETVIDLRSLTALSGQIDTWFALAPDESLIFLRTIKRQRDLLSYLFGKVSWTMPHLTSS